MARSRLSINRLQKHLVPGAMPDAGAPVPARNAASKASQGAPQRTTGAKGHVVRIIGGQWRRRQLKVENLPGLRPTADRVRETLFNWLAHQAGGDLTGWHCLDAFAGTGALGLEAASRGAASVTLVEANKQAVRHLHAAVQALQAANVRVVHGDGLAALRQQAPGSLHLVFIDPPFGDALGSMPSPLPKPLGHLPGHAAAMPAGAPANANPLYLPALKAARAALAPSGLVYLEAAQAWPAATLAALGYACLRHLQAGQVHAHLLAPLPAPFD